MRKRKIILTCTDGDYFTLTFKSSYEHFKKGDFILKNVEKVF